MGKKYYNLVSVWSRMSINRLPEQSCPVFNKLTKHEPAIQSQSKKTFDLDELLTWARDMVTWYWSADTFFDRCQLIITWMSNTKEVHSKPRRHVSLSTCYLGYGRHVVRLHSRRRRAYTPTSNTASHDNHEKINSWVFFFVSHIRVVYGAPLGGPSGRRSSAITLPNYSGAPVARRAAKRSPILIWETKGNPWVDFYGYHG